VVATGSYGGGILAVETGAGEGMGVEEREASSYAGHVPAASA
jgi:hypothetical protein